MNVTIWCSSPASRNVPWPLQTSTTVPEIFAKFTRFIIRPHDGHGRYRTAAAECVTGRTGSDPVAVDRLGPIPNTAACASPSAHTRSNAAASSHTPPHIAHSNSVVGPTCTRRISRPQPGHGVFVSSVARRAAAAPQCGQYALPANIRAKHEGQLIVANSAWQYAHALSAAAAGLPQLAQCSV